MCICFTGFRRWLSGEESACQCRRCRLDPWVLEDLLELEMATHSSFLACKIPWTEGPRKLELWVCKELDTTDHEHKTTLRSSLRSPAQVEGTQGFLTQPEKDLENPPRPDSLGEYGMQPQIPVAYGEEH